MLTLKAALASLFQKADWLEQQSTMLENAVEAVATVLAKTPVVKSVPGAAELTVPQARAMAENLAEGRRLLSAIMSFTSMLLEQNVRSIQASKLRADTRALKAETDARKYFVALVVKTRNLLNELAPSPEWSDVFEYRLEQEIMEKERLALPE